jgi:uncharacterized protein (TIGR02246 family)
MSRKAEDEARIREISRQWLAAAANKDVKSLGEFYAQDGRFMAPNAPAAEGREAARAAWQIFLQLPSLALTFEPTTVRVAQSGDIAFGIGTYELSFEGEQGRVQDRGKYVDLWEKIDGDWKLKADIFNSDLEPVQ